jgi:AraC-like DNA-binding protein
MRVSSQLGTGISTGSVGRGVGFMRITRKMDLYCGVKPYHEVLLTYAGRSEFWVDGRTGVRVPGSIQLLEPGQVYRDLRRSSPETFQVLSLDADLIAASCDALGIARGARLSTVDVAPNDPRAAALVRLHELAREGTDAFTIEAAITEGATAFASYMRGPWKDSGQGDARLRSNVRRARDFLLDHLAEPVTLDALAEHARTDKFRLCRAFSAEVGLPPHAFLTHARIARSRVLLRHGVRPSELAARVGFCDQSQLHRHFRRIVGVTPGEYARSLNVTGASAPIADGQTCSRPG